MTAAAFTAAWSRGPEPMLVQLWLTLRDSLQGWSLAGWATLAVAVMTATILSTVAEYDQSLPLATRATARTSLVLFLAAFMSSTLYRVLPNRRGRWLLNNRRYLGVAFAGSHAVHGVMVVALSYWLELEYELLVLAGGGLGYAFIAAMTVTSFDRAADRLGPRRWRLLHTTGAYYLWGIFAFAYWGHAADSLAYAAVFGFLLACLLLKLSVKLAQVRGGR